MLHVLLMCYGGWFCICTMLSVSGVFTLCGFFVKLLDRPEERSTPYTEIFDFQ